MRAMQLETIQPLQPDRPPLRLVELPCPQAAPGSLRIRVEVCGVCHTELDEIEGRTPPPQLPQILGHEVIGVVDQLGKGCHRIPVGTRVGVGWIYDSDGSPHENLSPSFRATGRDAPGGYAEWMVVPENYAFPIPESIPSEQAAPLMCAGAIGFRALRLTGLFAREPDQAPLRLGLMGFGGSAHLVLQLAQHCFPDAEIHAFARDSEARHLASRLGAQWCGDIADRPPEPLDAIIDTTPVWRCVVESLRKLKPGGRLVINAIRKEQSDHEELLRLNYRDDLWMEREIKSVANLTAADIRDFLPLAAAIPIRSQVQTYPLSAANQALLDLRFQPVVGAKVLRIQSAQ